MVGISRFLALALSTSLFGQHFYVGVKAGTPISDSGASATLGGRGGIGTSSLNVRRYTIGPQFEVALPNRFSVEADALFKRLERMDSGFLGQNFGRIARLYANSWEFPFLIKYRWGSHRLHPFAAAGGTFRSIPSFDGVLEIFAGGFQPPYSVQPYRVEESMTQGGWVVSGGVRMRAAGPLKITPEMRYTRWTSLRFFPTRNQVEFMLGVGF